MKAGRSSVRVFVVFLLAPKGTVFLFLFLFFGGFDFRSYADWFAASWHVRILEVLEVLEKISPLLPNSSGGKKADGIVLIENEAIVTEPIRVAETFNNYFVEVAGCNGNDSKIEEFDNHSSI